MSVIPSPICRINKKGWQLDKLSTFLSCVKINYCLPSVVTALLIFFTKPCKTAPGPNSMK